MTENFIQIVVAAPNGCDGPGLIRVLQNVARLVPAKFVSLSDLDVIGVSRTELVVSSGETRLMEFGALIELLSNCSQVVWANVFLCRTRAQADSILATEDYTRSLLKADALVRVVDADSYHICGRAEKVAFLESELGGTAFRRRLEELQFPE